MQAHGLGPRPPSDTCSLCILGSHTLFPYQVVMKFSQMISETCMVLGTQELPNKHLLNKAKKDICTVSSWSSFLNFLFSFSTLIGTNFANDAGCCWKPYEEGRNEALGNRTNSCLPQRGQRLQAPTLFTPGLSYIRVNMSHPKWECCFKRVWKPLR